MHALKKNFLTTWLFIKQSHAYFRDTLILHALMLFVALPLLSTSMKLVLKISGINYLSSDNILSLFQTHAPGLIALAVLFIMTLLVLYFEFTFLLLSIHAIQQKVTLSVVELFGLTLKKIRTTKWRVFLFFLLYLVILLPFSGLGFHSDLLSKVKIPAFVLDFIFEQRYRVVTSFILSYLVVLYFALRFIFVLPYLIINGDHVFAAIKKSWQETRKNFWRLLLQIVTLYLTVFIGVSFIFLLCIGGQMLVENLNTAQSQLSATIFLSLLKGLSLVQTVLLSTLLFYVMLFWLDGKLQAPEVPKRFYPKGEARRFKILRVSFLVVGLIGGAVATVAYNRDYLAKLTFSTPEVFSHRGVDLTGQPNGVQNSITAMKATAKLGVDYIEMDIFQTKDGKFAVVHDRNLQKLTGHNKNIDQLTLAQATALTVKDNGMTAPLASFDDYLTAAEKLQQKLLVEIKITPSDKKSLVKDFLAQYQTRLLKNGDWVQSLSYDVVEEIKADAPSLHTGYILPFNIVGPPLSRADFFVMEHTTLNQNFVDAAKSDGKDVYAWTINDVSTLDRVQFYGVDGVITDYVKLLDNSISNQTTNPTYSDKLLFYWIGIG